MHEVVAAIDPHRAHVQAARRHLDAALERLRVQLNVHIRRLQRTALAGEDGLAPGMVTPHELDARLARRHAQVGATSSEWLEPDEIAALDGAEQGFDDVSAALEAAGHDLPLRALAERFGLDAIDEILLLFAAASERSAHFPKIFGYLSGNAERPQPTAAIAMDTVIESASWGEVRSRLAPDAPLRWFGLLAPAGHAESAAIQRPLVLDARLARFLEGDLALDPTIAAWADLRPFGAFPDPIELAEGAAASLARLERLVDGHRGRFDALPLIVLSGSAGSGRRRWAHLVAEHLGMGTLAVDLGALATDLEQLEASLRAAVREARLQRAVLCLRGWDELAGGRLVASGEDDDGFVATASDALWRRGSLALERVLLGHDLPVALTITDRTIQLPEVRRGMHEVRVPMPDAEMAKTLWTRHLAGSDARDELPRELAVSFRLSPGQIISAADASVAAGRLDATAPTFGSVQQEVKRQLRHRLGDIARLRSDHKTWSELIASPGVLVQLRELVSRHRHRHKVMSEWRFGMRFTGGNALSALFEGPPGTGKTMAAGIVAGELGLDLFQVDLSKIVSKYIGETEKQLSTLFAEAERAGAIILFDEADSIFSQRTEVKSSNDRYANMKVNYLLQRIEQFDGIAILTTNYPENLDKAFGRRVTMRVTFPEPDVTARLALWRSMLEGCEQVDDEDIYLEEIAQEFELSGGHIKNSVLRAAYIAAARDDLIDHDTLRLAARMELKHQGKLLMGDPLRDLADRFVDDRSPAGPQGPRGEARAARHEPGASRAK